MTDPPAIAACHLPGAVTQLEGHVAYQGSFSEYVDMPLVGAKVTVPQYGLADDFWEGLVIF